MSVGGPPESMKNIYYLMAMDDALGMTPSDLALKYGYNPSRVSMIRQAPAYQIQVESIRQRIMERTIEQQANLAGKFDSEAPEAFETIRSIHRNPEMPPGERRQSAIAILDRSSCAPRVRKVDDLSKIEQGKVLQIPEKTFALFVTAAKEAGEVIDVEFNDLPEASSDYKDDPDYFEV